MEEGFQVESPVEAAEGSSPHWLVPVISVTTAVLAVLAAYSSLIAGQSAHHSLAELNQAAIYQSQASDQWNFYQAEGIKRHVFEVQRDAAVIQTGPGPAALARRDSAEAARYAAQQVTIRRDAEALEHRRDESEAVAQQYDARYQRLALAVAFYQIGIVVGSVAAIIRRPELWYLGLLGGAAGMFFLLQAMLLPVADVRAG